MTQDLTLALGLGSIQLSRVVSPSRDAKLVGNVDLFFLPVPYLDAMMPATWNPGRNMNKDPLSNPV